MTTPLENLFERSKPLGAWSLVCPMDKEHAVPSWIAHDGKRVAYVRAFRVRSMRTAERLKRVMQWAIALKHNSILDIRETIDLEGGGSLAVVSRYEEGLLLSSILAMANLARKAMPPGMAALVGVDLLEALEVVGGRLAPAWAHGGVRPETVLISRGGRAHLIDLGASGVLSAEEPLSTDPRWTGYASPEQVGTSRLGPGSDLFSLGVLLWEVLTNRPLFAGKSHADVKQRLLADAGNRVEMCTKAGMAPPLAAVIGRALATDPDERFPSAKAFATALQEAVGALGERHELSEYLDALHRLPLDRRRQTLDMALGKTAPMSLPPPPRNRAPKGRMSLPPPAPAATKIDVAPSSVRTGGVTTTPTTASKDSAQRSLRASPTADGTKPGATSARPSFAPRPASGPTAGRASLAPRPGKADGPGPAKPAEPAAPPSKPKEAPAPAKAPEAAKPAEPAEPTAPISLEDEAEVDVDVRPSSEAKPPAAKIELAPEPEKKPSEPAPAMLPEDEDDIDVDGGLADSAKPIAAKIEPVPTPEPEAVPAAPTSKPKDEPATAEATEPAKPAEPAAAASSAHEQQAEAAAAPAPLPKAPTPPPAVPASPPFDLASLVEQPSLDELERRSRRKWPTLLLGMVLGAGIALGVAYGVPGLQPGAASCPSGSAAPPSASAVAAPPPQPTEPETATTSAAGSSATATARATATSKAKAGESRPGTPPATPPPPRPKAPPQDVYE